MGFSFSPSREVKNWFREEAGRRGELFSTDFLLTGDREEVERVFCVKRMGVDGKVSFVKRKYLYREIDTAAVDKHGEIAVCA